MLSKFFKSKMPVVRFKAEFPMEISEADLREGLIYHRFKDEPAIPEVVGFVDFDNQYELEQQFRDHSHVFGKYFAGLFRIDNRVPPASAIKREVEKMVNQFLKRENRTFISRADKKIFTDQVKLELMSKTPSKTKFTPFVVDMTTGNGYYYSTGKKDFSLFEESLARAYGIRFFVKRIFESEDNTESEVDFLTFIWWDSENNSFSDMKVGKRDLATYAGDSVVVASHDQKLSTSGNVEEAKLAVSKGMDITKMDMLVHIGEDERKFKVTSEGEVSGLTFSPEMLPDSDDEDLTIFIEATAEAFGVLDAWKARYLEALENGNGLTPKIREVWGRGEYCSRVFEDV